MKTTSTTDGGIQHRSKASPLRLRLRYGASPVANKAFVPRINLVFVLIALMFGLSPVLPAANYDLTSDGSVDWLDIASFSQQWLSDNCQAVSWCAGADLNRNGIVRFDDFALLAQHWRSVYEYITLLLCGHEPAESDVEIRGPRAADPSLIIATNLPAPSPADPVFGDIPAATEGVHVLGLTWDNETDRKIEYGYRFADGFSFDLTNQDQIAFDVFIAAGAPLFPEGLIAIWDSDFGWNQSANLPTEAGQWCTIIIDVHDREETGLNEIDAITFEDIGEPLVGK